MKRFIASLSLSMLMFVVAGAAHAATQTWQVYHMPTQENPYGVLEVYDAVTFGFLWSGAPYAYDGTYTEPPTPTPQYREKHSDLFRWTRDFDEAARLDANGDHEGAKAVRYRWVK